jgi:SAM-dependent methyltransferase
MLKKDFNNLIDCLVTDSKNFSDTECFNLNSEKEKTYILQKAQRIKQTIDYFEYFLQKEDFRNHECKILDIGTSPFTFLYRKYFDVKVFTIDITELLERRCNLNNIIFRKCDLLKEDIPFNDNEFDIIIFTEVFEHLIGPPQKIFYRIRKVLNDKGVLVLSTPNLVSYYNRLKLLSGTTVLPPAYSVFKEEIDGDLVSGYGHWRKYTMSEIKELLRRYCFDIIRCTYILKPEIEIKKSKMTGLLKKIILKALFILLPASQFILVLAGKSPD